VRARHLGWIAILWIVGAAPATAAPSLAVYGTLPSLEISAISPTGKLVALVATVKDQRQLLILDDHSQVVRRALIGDIKLRSIAWAGEENVLLWYGQTHFLGIDFVQDKLEFTGVMVAPVADVKPWNIFQGVDTISGGVRGSYGIVQRDGRWYGYFGGITLESGTHRDTHYIISGAPELYEVDLQNHNTRRLAKRMVGDNTRRSWRIDEKGEVAATFEFITSDGSWRIVSDNHTLVSGKDPLGQIALLGKGPSGDTIAYQTVDAADVSHFFEIPKTGGTPTELLARENVADTYTDQRTRQLMGWRSDSNAQDAHFFDPRRDKVMRGTQRAFPNLNVELIDWDDAFDRLLVRTNGAGDPGTWWMVDIKTGDASELGSSYLIPAKDVGPIRMLSYKAADGTPLEGVLSLPPHRPAKLLPVVLLPHGGPAARDYPGFDWLAQAFVSRGYAVFQPNFRGSAGYGAAFERAGDGQWGRAMQTDISDGLAELARQGIVDPKRACILGASYGGYAALAGVTLQHGVYRCAVSFAGVADLNTYYQRAVTDSGRNHALVRNLDRELGSSAQRKSASPLSVAQQADAPILIVHGKDDVVVDYGQSTAMYGALKSYGKSVDMITLQDEDHWLSRSDTRLQLLTAATDFIERHNPADPEPAAK